MSWLIAFWLVVFFAGIMGFFNHLRNKRMRRRAQMMTAPAREPLVPAWLYEQPLVSQLHLPRVMIQCRPFKKELVRTRTGFYEPAKEAIDWAQRVVNEKMGGIKLPDDTCTVSIPMEPFSCGVAPTEFRLAAASGASGEAGHYTYQMVGEERMQVTFYTEAGVTYTAGYCIYIPRPYDSNDYYSRHVLDRCYKGPKYSVEEERRFSEVDVLAALKWTLCPKRRIPVTIGMDRAAGRMRHFEWNGDVRAFRMIDCDACASSSSSVTIDDRPPAYESLDFDKV